MTKRRPSIFVPALLNLVVSLAACASAQGQQLDALARLVRAVDADATAWTAALRQAVGELEAMAAIGSGAAEALFAVAKAEELRPMVVGAPLPDLQTKQSIRDALEWAQASLTMPAPPAFAPLDFHHPISLGLVPPRVGATPQAVQALVNIAIECEQSDVTQRIVSALCCSCYPDVARLFDHVFARHLGGETEAALGEAVAACQLWHPYAEAAGLLFLLREDNRLDTQDALLMHWRRWSGARLARLLPILLTYETEALPDQAAKLWPHITGLPAPAATEWSLRDRARAYQEWHYALQYQLDTEVAPLVDPNWDPANPIVAAFREAVAGMSVESQCDVARDAKHDVARRKTALRRLAFQGWDYCWDAIRDVVRTDSNWELVAYCLRLADELAPDRTEWLRRPLAQRLERLPGAEATQLPSLIVGRILEADTRENVMALASLADAVDPEGVCELLEKVPLGTETAALPDVRRHDAIRNSITAYGTLNRDRAGRFYRSLLASADGPSRRIGIYGVGELRVAEAVGDLRAVAMAATENAHTHRSTCVALGKMGTPAAHEALVHMLRDEPVVVPQSWAVIAVMERICGLPGGSPLGTWANGCWATVAHDRRAVAERFATAMRNLAQRTQHEQLANRARHSADTILAAAGLPQAEGALPGSPPGSEAREP